MRSFLRVSISAMRSFAALFQNFVTGTGSATLFALRDGRLREREVDEVGIFVFDLIEPGLDVLHVVDIFDQCLFRRSR